MRIKKMFFAFSLCLKLIFDFKTVEKKKRNLFYFWDFRVVAGGESLSFFVVLVSPNVSNFETFLLLLVVFFLKTSQFFRFRFFSSEVDFLRSDFVFKLPDLLDFDSFFLKWIFFNRIFS